MSKVIVTGAGGQLANCIKNEIESSEHTFIFFDRNTFDISDANRVNELFKKEKPEFCINCAAYTAVDKAESEPRKAELVNVGGPRNLAQACAQFNAKLIHISTDFVFDGQKRSPYNEKDTTNPLGVYGRTKLAGEKAIIENLKAYVILRTSWLYSEHGQNFMKTIMRLGREKGKLRVVSDQTGTPTYAGDLARFIIDLINQNTERYEKYHFSNTGVATWYDFALAIFEYAKIQCEVVPIKTNEYPTAAKRPEYSVLDKNRVKTVFDIEIPDWRDSLKECISRSKTI